MLLIHNGLLMAENELGLALPNRGLLFGDGFFETLIFADGRLRYAAGHHARMVAAAAALHLALPAALVSAETLEATLNELAAANALPVARLRLQLWRGGGGRYTPPTEAVEWLVARWRWRPSINQEGRTC